MPKIATVDIPPANSLICPCCGQQVPDANFLLDSASCTITNGKITLRLPPQQFRLAQFLIKRYPMAVTKEEIYDNVFISKNGEGPLMKIMDVLVCRIRPVLAEIGLVIETVWGVGYRLVEADPSRGNAILEASVRARGRNSKHMWKPEHDEQALDLMRRKMKATAIASIMKLPYMTVERNIRRLQSQV